MHDFVKPQSIDKKKTKKLKGEVKLTLKNAKTGKVEKVIEGENIVTNAISDLCDSDNYFGLADFTKLMPIYQTFFGGCLLLKRPFEEVDKKIQRDDDYFIKGSHINPVVAHAGDEMPSDFADDTKRGYPNTALLVKKKNSIKLAWEWSSSLGNGEISSIALCHKDVGNCGTGSTSNAFRALNPYTELQRSTMTTSGSTRIVGQLDERTGINYTCEDGNFTINYYHLAFDKAGLVDTYNPYLLTNTTTFSITYFRNLTTSNVAHAFDNDNKVLWLFTNGSSFNAGRFYYTKLPFIWLGSYWGVDFDNWEINYVNLETANLAFFQGNRKIPYQKKKIENGTQDIFYFPTGENNTYVTGLKRFNMQNQADVSEISFNQGLDRYAFDAGMCGKYDGDLLMVNNMVVNGTVGYAATTNFSYNFESSCIQPNSIASASIDHLYGKILLNKFFYSTKFNLKQSVNKTSAQTMVLEYTLSEVDEYDES